MFFLFLNKTLRYNNLKSKTAMNVKISVFVNCVEAIIYLLLYDLHDCTFNALIFTVPISGEEKKITEVFIFTLLCGASKDFMIALKVWFKLIFILRQLSEIYCVGKVKSKSGITFFFLFNLTKSKLYEGSRDFRNYVKD